MNTFKSICFLLMLFLILGCKSFKASTTKEARLDYGPKINVLGLCKKIVVSNEARSNWASTLSGDACVDSEQNDFFLVENVSDASIMRILSFIEKLKSDKGFLKDKVHQLINKSDSSKQFYLRISQNFSGAEAVVINRVFLNEQYLSKHGVSLVTIEFKGSDINHSWSMSIIDFDSIEISGFSEVIP